MEKHQPKIYCKKLQEIMVHALRKLQANEKTPINKIINQDLSAVTMLLDSMLRCL